MGRTDELPIPVEETYRDILRDAVARAGGQGKVATAAGINQATVSRTLSPGGRATYTTLLKISRVLVGVPSPVVPVRDTAHEQWCRIGALLEDANPTAFQHMLAIASGALARPDPKISVPDESDLEHLHAVVANPVPYQTKRAKPRR